LGEHRERAWEAHAHWARMDVGLVAKHLRSSGLWFGLGEQKVWFMLYR